MDKPRRAKAGEGHPSLTPMEKRDLLRLLRRLLHGGIDLAPTEGGSASAEAGEGPAVAEKLIRFSLREGLLQRSGNRLTATSNTAGYLRRSLLADDDAFAEQHRLITEESVDVEGVREKVRRNLAESPLSLLSRLKDRAGSSFLPPEAVEAGERLLRDFTRGQLQPRVTASWEPRLSGRGKGDRGGQADIADTAIAARDRFSRAVDAMGPELAGVAIDVCCFAKGLEAVERERQWPARSAKLMLRTALLALSRHYAPPPARSGRTSHHWGASDYRPSMPR